MSLRLEGISFSYESQSGGVDTAPLFSNLDLEVPGGGAVLVLGETGSGKTTLSSIASAITPMYNPGSLDGRILLDGEPFSAAHEVMDRLSLVPQDPTDYFLTTSLEDELATPLESLCWTPEAMEEAICQALADWGLERYRQSQCALLSGGEKKRLALALAYITKPRYVILDESFDELDAHWRSVLEGRIARRQSASLVTSSRFIEDFKGLFDHIYLLEEGRLVEIDEERAIQLSHFSFTPPHASSSKGAISVNDLTFSRGAFHLCAERFHLEGGEIVALTGANGSGKSTFSRLLCALERPDSGSVQIDGKTQDARALQRSVGYVFQNPDLQIFLPTVRDELMTTLSFLRLGRKEREERLEELADLFGLVLSDSALLMSQGARKRLQCAIYYSLERPFYILDEIEAALPYAESARMLSLLSSNGAGILVISHDRAFASAVSNRSCHMEEGRLYED